MRPNAYAEDRLWSLFVTSGADRLPLRAIYGQMRGHGITRKDLKEARKALGIQSETENGVTYWRMP